MYGSSKGGKVATFTRGNGVPPEGVNAWQAARSLAENLTCHQVPAKTNDLWNGRGERLSGTPRLDGRNSGKLK